MILVFLIAISLILSFDIRVSLNNVVSFRCFIMIPVVIVACQKRCLLLHSPNPLKWRIGKKWNMFQYRFFFFSICPYLSPSLHFFRMMLANYLGRKGRKTCLKGVVVFSVGWDVFECTASLEKPLDRFLFNSYLTSCLQASVDRSAWAGLLQPLTRC